MQLVPGTQKKVICHTELQQLLIYILTHLNIFRFLDHFRYDNMNEEEQAILDFFAQSENLSLALSVAEQIDKLREQMNNRLWLELLRRLERLTKEHGLPWRIEPTEDRNAPDCLVGLHCSIDTEQPLYLRPMMEQQYLGGQWRIYFGLMWSAAPSREQLRIAAVSSLKALLQKAGFKNNESFLAWQWTAFHPRRKDFLLRHAKQPEKLLDDIENIFGVLLIDHREATEFANAALKDTPDGLASSLKRLRDELID